MNGKISDFGWIGYGVDIINMVPKELLVDFSWQNTSNAVTLHTGQKVQWPDNWIVDPSPNGNRTVNKGSGMLSTSRDWQTNAVASLLGGGTAKGREFTAKANVQNENFSVENESKAKQWFSANSEIAFLTINNVSYDDCIRSAVSAAIQACGTDSAKIQDFYRQYGTHVVSGGKVGGRLSMNTEFTFEASSAYKFNSVNIHADLSTEADQWASGALDINVKASSESEDFKRATTIHNAFQGGQTDFNNANDWFDSLQNAMVPVQGSTENFTETNGVLDAGDYSMAFMASRYEPIYSAFNLSGAQLEAFEKELDDILGGANPFSADVHRINSSFGDGQWFKDPKTKLDEWELAEGDTITDIALPIVTDSPHYQGVFHFEGLPLTTSQVWCHYKYIGSPQPYTVDCDAGAGKDVSKDNTPLLGGYCDIKFNKLVRGSDSGSKVRFRIRLVK